MKASLWPAGEDAEPTLEVVTRKLEGRSPLALEIALWAESLVLFRMTSHRFRGR